jgi:hypothetical protein
MHLLNLHASRYTFDYQGLKHSTTKESTENKTKQPGLMAPHIPPPPSFRYLKYHDPTYQPREIAQSAIEERATEFSHQTFVSAPESRFKNLASRVVNNQTTGMKPIAFVSHNAQTQVFPWPPSSLKETLPELASNYDMNGLSGKTQSNNAETGNSLPSSSARHGYYQPTSNFDGTHNGDLVIPEAIDADPTAVYSSSSGQAADIHNPLLYNANLPCSFLPDDHLPNNPNLSFVPLLNATTHYMSPELDFNSQSDTCSGAQPPWSQYDGRSAIATSTFDAQQAMFPSVAQVMEPFTLNDIQAAKAFVMPDRDCPICGYLLPTLDALCFTCIDKEERLQKGNM